MFSLRIRDLLNDTGERTYTEHHCRRFKPHTQETLKVPARIDGFGAVRDGDEIAAAATGQSATQYFDHPSAGREFLFAIS
jgi:hypothetical protein